MRWLFRAVPCYPHRILDSRLQASEEGNRPALPLDTMDGTQGLGDLIDAGISAALAAGREILSVYGAAFAVELKDDRSPLTEADKRAHRAIVAELERTGLPVLSEEGRSIAPEERQEWKRYWLVDPLDGTKEFVKRNGEFTVNIALMERDAELAGALGAAVPIGGVPLHGGRIARIHIGSAFGHQADLQRAAHAGKSYAAVLLFRTADEGFGLWALVRSAGHDGIGSFCAGHW